MCKLLREVARRTCAQDTSTRCHSIRIPSDDMQSDVNRSTAELLTQHCGTLHVRSVPVALRHLVGSVLFSFGAVFSGVVCICPMMMSRRNTKRDLIIRPDGCVDAHAFTDSMSTGLTRGTLCLGTPNECFFTIPSAIPVVMPWSSPVAKLRLTV